MPLYRGRARSDISPTTRHAHCRPISPRDDDDTWKVRRHVESPSTKEHHHERHHDPLERGRRATRLDRDRPDPPAGRAPRSLASSPATRARHWRRTGSISRGWIGWLDAAFLDPFDVEHAHIELYARWCESEGKARSTIGRRLSTICGFYKYCSYSGPRSEAAPSLFMASRPRSGGHAISARGDDASIALLCGLGRRPEEVADSLPGHVLGASSDDCVDDLSFATRWCEGERVRGGTPQPVVHPWVRVRSSRSVSRVGRRGRGCLGSSGASGLQESVACGQGVNNELDPLGFGHADLEEWAAVSGPMSMVSSSRSNTRIGLR